MKTHLSSAAMFVASLIIWLAVSAASGGGEAWDGGTYWSLGLPAVYVTAAVLGWLGRGSVWSLGLWCVLGQFAGLLLTASGWSLWPLGLLMLAVLSLPAIAAAAIARFLRNRPSAGTTR